MQLSSDPAFPDHERTIGGYPVRSLVVTCGELRVRLLAVERLENFVDPEQQLRDPAAPEPPYWAHLWPGSRALAGLLATAIPCAGRSVIDLGCGLGLAGLVAALRGAEVTMIDTASEALQFARASAALNGCHIRALQTDFRATAVRQAFDYCVAADVTYGADLQLALAAFLAGHLAAGGRAWCAESVRIFDQGLQHACRQRGLHVTEHEMREVDDGREVVVRVTEVYKPADPG